MPDLLMLNQIQQAQHLYDGFDSATLPLLFIQTLLRLLHLL